MSLLEEIEKDKAALKALEETENQEDDQVFDEETSEEPEQDQIDLAETKEKGEENGDGEEDTSEEDKPEEKPDNAAYARLRREKAAAEKRARELEEQLSKPQKQVEEEVKAENIEPDINKDPIEWLKWNNQRLDRLEKQLEEKNKAEQETQLYSNAKSEFMAIEQEFAKTTEDYNDVSSFLAQKIADSIRVLNPNITPQDLQNQIENQILTTAGRYYNQGLNPVEEMYYLAKEQFGYQPKDKESAKEEAVKPDIRKVAENRKRNAGMAGTSGGGSPQITREVAANMTTAEFSRLSKSERQRLLTEG